MNYPEPGRMYDFNVPGAFSSGGATQFGHHVYPMSFRITGTEDLPGQVRMSFDMLDDTGSDMALIFQEVFEDIRAISNGWVATFLSWEVFNTAGGKIVLPTCALEVNVTFTDIHGRPNRLIGDWATIQVAVLPGPGPPGRERLSGPWMRVSCIREQLQII
ncbi:hypothetical protein N7532_001616 [Penicillium argentinense]|uniref:Uncharacterized protein n=1 Tax=Penicillium argentinense TaxID=1131581 RepID=A0A9W9G325_9EURO|nr:uncharacterized protein N7532_001616 [Penicillium argentinense]KAJ5111081.1 hypothetical protein N7532_001616 [Penicillium argentinense]